jgi:hypothetical protein
MTEIMIIVGLIIIIAGGAYLAVLRVRGTRPVIRLMIMKGA